MNLYEVDLLVIGAGISGLRAAWQGVKNNYKTAIAYIGEGASPGILAFNVPKTSDSSNDNCQVYYDDIISSGRYLNNHKLAKNLSLLSIELTNSLKEIGYQPEKDEKGNYLRRHLGGCSYPRSLFSGDSTGKDIMLALWSALREKNVIEIENVKILMPIMKERRLIGAIGIHLQTKELIYIKAKNTVLASGGLGRLYKGSTYPSDVSGSSAMFALLAGAKITDMEFIQFEPTVCFTHPSIDKMEIPTAMFGDGAYLKNKTGNRFMLSYGFKNEAGIEKSFMAKCINKEIKEGRGSRNGGVYFDARHLPKDILEKYSLRVNRLKEAGYDLSKDLVEVRPAAHSHMGGVVIDENCYSGVPGLFIAGEAAGGVHGASRIAGNSGSDVLVFGDRAGYFASKDIANNKINYTRELWDEAVHLAQNRMQGILIKSMDPQIDITDETSALLASYCGIEREGKLLDFALGKLYKLKKNTTEIHSPSIDEIEIGLDNFRSILLTEAILMAAFLRQESRGPHVRLDYPNEREFFEKNISHSLAENNFLQYYISKH